MSDNASVVLVVAIVVMGIVITTVARAWRDVHAPATPWQDDDE